MWSSIVGNASSFLYGFQVKRVSLMVLVQVHQISSEAWPFFFWRTRFLFYMLWQVPKVIEHDDGWWREGEGGRGRQFRVLSSGSSGETEVFGALSEVCLGRGETEVGGAEPEFCHGQYVTDGENR